LYGCIGKLLIGEVVGSWARLQIGPVGLGSSHDRFREVAMDQIYLTVAISGLTFLVGAYVLSVALA
jgi:hypothetical protein